MDPINLHNPHHSGAVLGASGFAGSACWAVSELFTGGLSLAAVGPILFGGVSLITTLVNLRKARQEYRHREEEHAARLALLNRGVVPMGVEALEGRS